MDLTRGWKGVRGAWPARDVVNVHTCEFWVHARVSERKRDRGGRKGGRASECECNNIGPYDLSQWERSSSFLVPGLS